ncbi:MAG: SAM-dependent methyltransferase, partial [Ignavibacteria bacterium]|nr:SAM-dependent methyltransferase [Ignavibacteria bacterium]
MKIKSTAYNYDKQKVKYTANQQTDPAIAKLINSALGDAETVLNVGAGTGSY